MNLFARLFSRKQSSSALSPAPGNSATQESAEPPPQPANGERDTRSIVGKLEYFDPERFAVSPDNRHFAYVTKVGDGFAMVVDSSQGNAYEFVGKPIFSPDSKKVAYSAKVPDQDKWCIVVNGSKMKEFTAIFPKGFSPDGTSFAYKAIDFNEWLLVVDGAIHLELRDKSALTTFTFSPDGSRTAYVRAGRTMVVDGKEHRTYNRVLNPIFSPDGSKVAYPAVKSRKGVWVMDGEEISRCDDISPASFSFSPDSQRIAYAGRLGGRWYVWIDNDHGEGFEAIRNGEPVFSPNSKRVAYVAFTKGQSFLVVNDHKSVAYEGISDTSPTFSADGHRIACSALRGGKWYAIADGQELGAYDDIAQGTPLFSPNAERIAYGAQRAGTWFVVADTAEQQFPFTGYLVFSPCSRHIAYVTNRSSVVLDGREQPQYEGIAPPAFSPDGSHLAYAAAKGGKFTVVVDGEEGDFIDAILGDPKFSFDSDSSFHYLANDGETVYLVEKHV